MGKGRNMEKKKPDGIIFLGWFFIITSALTLLGLLSPKHYAKLQGNLYYQTEFLYFTIIPFLVLFAGIHILKLKNWARKLIIIIYSISLVFTLMQLLFISSNIQGGSYYKFMQKSMNSKIEAQKREIATKYKPEYQQEAAKKIEKMSNTIIETLPVFLYVLMGLAMIWNACIIYYFTRPKVKEMFK